jgi:hypothetical protein
MSDDDYKGPPFDLYPEEFRQKAIEMSKKTGIPPMDIVKHVHKTCVAVVTEHMRRKKLAQELEERGAEAEEEVPPKER